MSFQPLPNTPPNPDDFRPENFKKKSGVRDYLIYLVVLVILLGVGGGAYYYYTRSPAEQRELKAKLDRAVGNDAAAANAKEGKVKRKQLDLGGVLEGETEAVDAAAPERKTVAPKAEAVSAYGGGGQSLVLASDNAQLPKPRPEFIKFVESLKVSGVLQGNPAKAMISGRMFRVGAVIDPELGVSFVGVDSVQKFLILRDKTGAELHLTY
jgi:hypothetical protein